MSWSTQSTYRNVIATASIYRICVRLPSRAQGELCLARHTLIVTECATCTSRSAPRTTIVSCAAGSSHHASPAICAPVSRPTLSSGTPAEHQKVSAKRTARHTTSMMAECQDGRFPVMPLEMLGWPTHTGQAPTAGQKSTTKRSSN